MKLARGILATMVASMLAVVSLSPAASAQAGPRSWDCERERWPNDGDAGGVSGAATLQWNNTAAKAWVAFDAYSEKFTLVNKTKADTRGRLWLKNAWGAWVVFDMIWVDADESSERHDLSLDEGEAVQIELRLNGRGTCSISTLCA
ncbi:hypothetical protein ACIBHY_40980 [Nonomuraea sp. NPDC050547]|uniref:hypothetical protein n=1 Tax=Nonomuraea sp. NPDC050547 TaxID=3364368 RepID=UPI0037B1107D